MKPRRSGAFVHREYPADMVALLKLPTRQWELIHRADDNGTSILVGTVPAMKMIDLSALTVDELDLFKKFINKAIEDARPICTELDRIAAEALANGDIRHRRLYRPLPIYAEMDQPDADKKEPGQLPPEPGPGGDVTEHGKGLPGRP